MTTYVIGDLQGCFDELQSLLKSINYQSENDHLWFVGDIVNRGPKSLECLRFVKELSEQGKADTVLGNHDFHLLAAYAGLEKFTSKSDTLSDILNAPDVDNLLDWLRLQPLLVSHPVYQAVMVHAGIPPQWTIKEAKGYAKEVQLQLAQPDWQNFVVNHLFGSEPNTWDNSLSGYERIRYIVNAFARMRFCDANGKLEFKLKSAPTESQSEYQPWFVFPNRRNKDYEIFFGHWSTLGAIDAYHIHSTDTGCLWGGQLTAYAIESKQRYTIDCEQQCKPKLKKKK
ncbi:symmetrical bis(5'-nucleosyl)-tetraphosphatase [Thiomicrorhabdus lithotrophica]|uniref:Bis(5'-nucleosyl)-tetraphosphatase, symmetrical n=1 Tax=Thiomicrorhabdus lithotrophica TaxID=2949997 RepID=A0ABY8CBA3_9GAMM|nr:symmetrical bis(5'-nucleosyl)-tetraphosphatase [Thiomicrorhabdus lithotrophica]WEJ63245.1 symmetrical bis(5'-nucleosyl)-tetraphosphatase [Thiomicrorhabdus lithotrophica]